MRGLTCFDYIERIYNSTPASVDDQLRESYDIQGQDAISLTAWLPNSGQPIFAGMAAGSALCH